MRKRDSFIFSFLQPYLPLEPAIVLFYLVHGFTEQADVNLCLQKRCRNCSTSEPDITTPCDNVRAGINFVADVNSKYLLPGGIFTIIIVIMMSAWSDKSSGRRKFYIILPMVMKLLQLINSCLQSYFWNWPALIAILPNAVFHSALPMRIASIIYVFSVSSPNDRTHRIILLYVLSSGAKILSSGVSGYAMLHFGFFYPYAFCMVLILIAIVHSALWIENTSTNDSQNWFKCIQDFFDVTYVIRAFRLVYRKSNGNEKTIIVLLTLINIFAWFVFIGEYSVLYLYLRHRFGWNECSYSLYVFYRLIGISIGSVICFGVNKLLKISNSAIATFAAFLDIIATLCYFFATQKWQLYLIPLLDLFHGFALSVCDSIQSKFFESNEAGRLFCVHMVLGLAMPFTFPAYNILFQKTMDFAPQSIFLLSSVVNVIIFVLYGVCHTLLKTLPKDQDKHISSCERFPIRIRLK